MPWTFEEIETDWLGTGSAFSPKQLVALFDRVEKVLGRNWIEASRRSIRGGGVSRGLAPALRVADMGQKLAALDGVLGLVHELVERIRQNDHSAEAELAAIYLLRSRYPAAIFELYPRAGSRIADFRACAHDGPWTYVEVAQPNESEEQQAANRILKETTTPIQQISTPFVVEVYLEREPQDSEMPSLIESILVMCRRNGIGHEVLPNGLGFLFLNYSEPGRVVRLQLPGSEDRPRIGVIAIAGGGGKPNRKIAVSLPFSDHRAESFLTAEARQLPKDAPGLVALEVSRASGGLKTWAPLLSKRLQPQMHTRVSAVCLFDDALLISRGGASSAGRETDHQSPCSISAARMDCRRHPGIGGGIRGGHGAKHSTLIHSDAAFRDCRRPRRVHQEGRGPSRSQHPKIGHEEQDSRCHVNFHWSRRYILGNEFPASCSAEPRLR